MPRVGRLFLCVAAALFLRAGPAAGHTSGGACVPLTERCEHWSAAIQGPPVATGSRPDEFPGAVAVAGSTVYSAVKGVDLNMGDPYSSIASWVISARDVFTGVERWR